MDIDDDDRDSDGLGILGGIAAAMDASEKTAEEFDTLRIWYLLPTGQVLLQSSTPFGNDTYR